MYKALSPGNIGHSVTFKDAAKIGAEEGFKGFWFDIEGDSKISVSETKELLAETGLIAGGFGLPVEFRKDEQVFNDDFAKLEGYARYAADVGMKRCATYIMPFSEIYTFEENFELHRSRLKKCCEVFNEYGIVLGLEFIGPPKVRRGKKYEFVYNLDQMLELCDAIGTGNCGLLLDIWHWDLAGQSLEDFKKITNDQVALVHIMDAPEGIAPEEQDDSPRRLPGETGVLRIAEFFEGLNSIGYDGPVVAEPFVKALSEMSFKQAVETVITAINSVWPE
ncbi:MAG: sugar phosphate isomerase/epimerase [Oscillospiraceae bacterium]|jgi:sugar phosphate isomerase/epimerase|nr:sugar phosphate isomerase/epimerase [Oscillospiraceae bacterium]